MTTMIDSHGVQAPIFIGIATKCTNNPKWQPDSPTQQAQFDLLDDKRIYLGANTDSFLSREDRRFDDCHMSKSGQAKAGNAYADSIQKYHKNN